ncbi:hypothetical protein HB662_26900 [Roseomonas frigidaquae]|uniref:Uncharacterized protein n=1 Tax=Falsiroseomonas frigidaquae TaxID=487318 RepID=A0ABX1F7R8_9PROT|nr:hypothetical protein [Falsiroseomonas frigidaquae]NKE48431.1 hypothetical protein [Falsiroseomonas frigidaquae]
MNMTEQQRIFDGFLREADGRLEIVERALVEAKRKAGNRAPSSSLVVETIRSIKSGHGALAVHAA